MTSAFPVHATGRAFLCLPHPPTKFLLPRTIWPNAAMTPSLGGRCAIAALAPSSSVSANDGFATGSPPSSSSSATEAPRRGAGRIAGGGGQGGEAARGARAAYRYAHVRQMTQLTVTKMNYRKRRGSPSARSLGQERGGSGGGGARRDPRWQGVHIYDRAPTLASGFAIQSRTAGSLRSLA